MAGEWKLGWPYSSTLFGVLFNEAGLVWYIVGQVFEAWGTGSRTAADYGLVLDKTTGNFHYGDRDANVANGAYTGVIHVMAGASPADSDLNYIAGSQFFDWTTDDGQVLTLEAFEARTLEADQYRTLGTGSISFDYTITSSATDLPLEGVTVVVTTDIAGANLVAQGTTSILGVVTFELDAGTYYFWCDKSGYSFTRPDTEVVA